MSERLVALQGMILLVQSLLSLLLQAPFQQKTAELCPKMSAGLCLVKSMQPVLFSPEAGSRFEILAEHADMSRAQDPSDILLPTFMLYLARRSSTEKLAKLDFMRWGRRCHRYSVAACPCPCTRHACTQPREQSSVALTVCRPASTEHGCCGRTLATRLLLHPLGERVDRDE